MLERNRRKPSIYREKGRVFGFSYRHFDRSKLIMWRNLAYSYSHWMKADARFTR